MWEMKDMIKMKSIALVSTILFIDEIHTLVGALVVLRENW